MIQKQKGTYDVFSDLGTKTLYLENLIKTLMEKYNYDYVRTPIFEASELFHRGVGETTDIVSKETYNFKDKGDRDISLRPEGTAGVVRSFIENKLYGNASYPVKTWYYGPMFRYERPQSGRYREFYQFGVEVFGSDDALMDAEVISIPVNFYQLLGLKGIKVNINTLGDTESRNNYREALIEYFKPHIDELCEDCKTRFLKNPLRILDCKVDCDSEILKNAPTMDKYLTEESISHFNQLQGYLNALGIEYTVNPKLVRGLDYYTHTVFEVEANIPGFGSQNVLCGGGRYNNLVESLDGPNTPAVGFAIGMERLIQALDSEKISLYEKEIDVYVIPIETSKESLSLVQLLRLNGFKTEMDYMNRNIKNNFKQAEKMNAKYVILVGSEEVKTKVLTVKDNHTKEEFQVKSEDLIVFLDSKVGEHNEE